MLTFCFEPCLRSWDLPHPYDTDGLKIILTTVKNKVKHPKACFTIEYHLCHIDDQSILAAIVHKILAVTFLTFSKV
jgi:hypothetical protein